MRFQSLLKATFSITYTIVIQLHFGLGFSNPKEEIKAHVKKTYT